MVMDLLGSPTVQLIALAAFALLGRGCFLRGGDPHTAAGAIAMTLGIFVLGALQRMPFPVEQITRLMTLGGLLVWVYLVVCYAGSYFQGRFYVHTEDAVGSFAIGTWVAGTAVLARLLVVTLPDWRPLALGLGVITLAVWLWYLALIISRYRIILTSPTLAKATGRLLLATVSTLSLLLLIAQLFRERVPIELARSLIGLGFLFYVLGLVLIVQRYKRQTGWRLSHDWDNTNCILHGALSIIGLAAVDSQALPYSWTTLIWIAAAVMFTLVEAVELCRLVARVRAYGWREGIGIYNVSQWSRNFTFGMFYAFSLRLHDSPGELAVTAISWPVAVRGLVVAWGQYVVLALLLIEVGLFLRQNLTLRLPALLVRPKTGGYS